MTIARALVGAITTLALVAPSSAFAQAVPLAGTGENLQPISRIKIGHPTEIEMAGDWAFVANDLGNGDKAGLVIVNIADPAKPFIEGRWNCEAGWGDIDITPDANYAFLTNAHGGQCIKGQSTWVAIVDMRDKANPKLIGSVKDDDTMDYVHTATLDNNLLYTNPQVWAGYPQNNPNITIFDVSDKSKPVKKGVITSSDSKAGFAHDSYIDHRPDGKSLMYVASVHKSEVIDITNPLAAAWLQRTTSAETTIAHDVQPNFDRKIIIVDDEGAAGGQLDETVSACGKAGGPGPAGYDSGSVHFYAAAADGTFANGGAVELGSFNAPANANTGACVAHVFWTAPSENRLTQAYYRTGAFIVDFTDPANAKSLGWFVANDADGSNYWSFKPHRGYLFAGDQIGGLDILKYTGEGGNRWPATAGPAEIQHSKRQGVPYVPITTTGPGGTQQVATTPLPGATQGAGATARSLGKFAFTAKLRRVPGRKGKRATLTLTFTKAKKRVAKLRIKRKAGRKATVKVKGVAVTGSYRWTLKAGKRRLAGGVIRVRQTKGALLSANATLSATAK